MRQKLKDMQEKGGRKMVKKKTKKVRKGGKKKEIKVPGLGE